MLYLSRLNAVRRQHILFRIICEFLARFYVIAPPFSSPFSLVLPDMSSGVVGWCKGWAAVAHVSPIVHIKHVGVVQEVNNKRYQVDLTESLKCRL